MNEDKVLYFDDNGVSKEVHVLVFNDAINIYDVQGDSFIKAYSLKGASVNNREEAILVYPQFSRQEYLQVSAGSNLAETLIRDISNANRNIVKRVVGHRLLWFGVIIVGVIVGLYFLIMALVPYIGATIISRDVEINMGNKLKEVMLAEERATGSIVDSAGTVKLQAFADKVKLSDNYPIHVTLVNSKTINAYALPGGQIVVYSGMLDRITEADELVALLAHEASHVNRRHSLRSMLRSVADALVLSILFNDVSAITATILGNAQSLRGLDYSRSAEREADEYGMNVMLQNNIDVSGMKKLMQILQEGGDVPENISFLSSHPLTKKRIEAAEEFIDKHPQKENVDNNLQILFRQLKD
jgi:Zn-dependent protease with chaperone function